MSYRIEFTGSLNERRDLNQATSNNSLTNIVSYQPSGWVGTSGAVYTALSDPVGYYVHVQGQIIGQTISTGGISGAIGFGAGSNNPWNIVSEIFPEFTTINWSINIRWSEGGSANWQVWLSSGPNIADRYGTLLYTNTNSGNATFFTRTGSVAIPSGGRFITFSDQNMEGGFVWIKTLTFTSNATAPTITDSTFQEGSLPTGGNASTGSITTIIGGANGTPGAANKIEVITNNDGPKVSLNHPAESTEDTDIQMKSSKVITATSSDFTTTVSGLDATNKLSSSDTKVTILKMEGATEK